MPEQLKVSEIPGYLDQIETGGGGEFSLIENVTFADSSRETSSLTKSDFYEFITAGDMNLNGTLKFTPKENNVWLFYLDNYGKIEADNGLMSSHWNNLTKGTEYTLTFNELSNSSFFVFLNNDLKKAFKNIDEFDCIILCMHS